MIFSEGIHTEKPRFYIAFIDSSGIYQCLEINQVLFDTLDRFELEDLSFMNEVDNHYEYAELTEQTLNARAAIPSESLENTVCGGGDLRRSQRFCQPDAPKRRHRHSCTGLHSAQENPASVFCLPEEPDRLR